MQSFLFAIFALFFCFKRLCPRLNRSLCDTACSTFDTIDSAVNHLCTKKKKPNPKQNPPLTGKTPPRTGLSLAGKCRTHPIFQQQQKRSSDYKHRAPSRFNCKPRQWSRCVKIPQLPLLVRCLPPCTSYWWPSLLLNQQKKVKFKQRQGYNRQNFLHINIILQRELKSKIRFAT